MTPHITALIGPGIFDGETLHTDHAVLLDGAKIHAICPAADIPAKAEVTRLAPGTLCPGFVDLQVNGGGGILVNDDPSPAALRTIAEAHARLGATSILPTLITDTPDTTHRAINGIEAAIAQGINGILGLHLEGPHLSQARKGAHEGALIRPMDPADLEGLLDAATRLPLLKVTLAPETVTPAQIAALRATGVLVSLGHSDATFETCRTAAQSGATCVTHLFNAMSQLTNRAPGLVGAALTLGGLSAGLIADGIHVHPATAMAAMAAKTGPGQIFLVSDAMAVAGSAQTAFSLNGRKVLRHDGRLTLEDGTLAGADLDLRTAIENLINWGVPRAQALAMATAIPAALAGAPVGRLAPGARADVVYMPSAAGAPLRVWQAGRETA